MTESTHNILALDIAFGPACACLIRRDGSIFSAIGNDDRPHSQTIMPLLQTLLADAKLDWPELNMLAAGVGPGSFTGLRIAAATLAGINTSLDLPLMELSSLAISALQAERDTPLYVIEDGRAGLAYFACYQGDREVSRDACLTWEEIGLLPPQSYTAYQLDEQHLPRWTYIPPLIPRSQAMARLAIAQAGRLENMASLPRFSTPAYLIPSQAERNAQ